MAAVWNQVKAFFDKIFGKLTKAQRTRLLIAAVLFIAIVSFLAFFLTRKTYEVLYSNMDAKEAGDVYNELVAQGVDAKVEGSDILVPKGEADRLLISMASSGYPETGFTYDILKDAFGLGTTNLEKEELIRYQMEDRIAKTINAMEAVRTARVMIVLADNSPFVVSQNNQTASAAVVLELNTARLTDEEAWTVGQIVMGAVPNLTTDNIQLADTNMRYYPLEEASDITLVSTQLELKKLVQEDLERQAKKLLEPVFGQNGFVVSAAVTLNFDRRLDEETVFEPPVEGAEGGVEISLRELTEQIQNAESGNVAGFDPNGAAPEYPEVGGDGSLYEKVSREVNYELNELKSTIERAQGRVEDLELAVLLNSELELDDYSENVKTLVAAAMGVPAAMVKVDRLPFIPVEELEIPEPSFFERIDVNALIRLAVIAISVIVLALILMMIVRSFRGAQPVTAEGVLLADGTIGGLGEGIDLLADDEAGEDFTSIQTRKDTTASQIEQYIESDPAAVAALLRNWLADDYGR